MATSATFVPWIKILGENALPRVCKLMERVERLANKSPCPILKVAYLLVNPELAEIAFAINKYKGSRMQPRYSLNEPPNWKHAEKELAMKIAKSNKRITECCAIGNFSPCQYCVMDLKSINVGALIFSNLYWDTPALELAEKLGMKLFYFSNSRLHVLTHSIISSLSRLNIVPIRTHLTRKELPKLDAFNSEEKMTYIRTHKAELTNLLNNLMMEFLNSHESEDDPEMKIRVSKMLSQIDTEQECFRWAKRNVLLRKQPW
jgi:hypothetical protein